MLGQEVEEAHESSINLQQDPGEDFDLVHVIATLGRSVKKHNGY
jgi:hypothetical protein